MKNKVAELLGLDPECGGDFSTETVVLLRSMRDKILLSQ